MAKKKALVETNPNARVDENFDFSDFLGDANYIDGPDDTAIANVMNGVVQAHSNQIGHSIELTRLVIEKSIAKDMSEDDVLALFKKTSRVLSEQFSLKDLMEK